VYCAGRALNSSACGILAQLLPDCSADLLQERSHARERPQANYEDRAEASRLTARAAKEASETVDCEPVRESRSPVQ
jgi:hypothetical protein